MKTTLRSKVTIGVIATSVALLTAIPAAGRLQVLVCDTPACSASVVTPPGGTAIITNAQCGMGTGPDFGLAITITNVTGGTCVPVQNLYCEGTCSYHVQLQYVTYGTCFPVDLTGTECGSTITPQTGLGYCGACTVINKNLQAKCGANCALSYTLTEPIAGDFVTLNATLVCDPCTW